MTEAKKGKQGLLKDSILSFSMKNKQTNPQTHKNLTKAKPVQCYRSYGSINKHQGSYHADFFCGINQNWHYKKETSIWPCCQHFWNEQQTTCSSSGNLD